MTELRLETQCVPLEEALGQLVTDRRFSSFLEIRLQCDLHNRETLSSQATEHLIAILREAISNTIRHADAQLVQIDVWADNEKVHLGLQDDGVGLPEQLRSGYGMRNMHDRARLLGGKLLIENANEKGTRISLIVPLKGV
jgi:two-component system nitrate/nitrite sensor histidine kinase NarX